jgi:hypothetical protein
VEVIIKENGHKKAIIIKDQQQQKKDLKQLSRPAESRRPEATTKSHN